MTRWMTPPMIVTSLQSRSLVEARYLKWLGPTFEIYDRVLRRALSAKLNAAAYGGRQLPPVYLDFTDKDLSILSSDARYLIVEKTVSSELMESVLSRQFDTKHANYSSHSSAKIAIGSQVY
ncbi:hypothetical protein ALP05_200115 [Pseudomonas caricapapayae]|uniref:Uncharacterized protein n=1 Tax=Pseudomonas caricapapayae TaxID=46678 RepID=A0A3M6FB16_9PSED|nr:hypothetical protein ALP05_200115 [Pseudomonas caricapapayae]